MPGVLPANTYWPSIERRLPAAARQPRAIVAGMIADDEEIFPDSVSQGTGPAFFAEPNGRERQVAAGPGGHDVAIA